MRAYYNDNDKFVCAWLRELIASKLITVGDVDERSITEVSPDDLKGYDRVHFFAGIAGWAYALQLANWKGPAWTGSCPCQPFSAAGKQKGEADERHLWPEFRRLIAECHPPTIFGEQVASRLGREWLAGVRADLEALGYAVGGADLCAASVGAPHIRQRLYWVAHTNEGQRRRLANCEGRERDGQAAGWIEGDREPQSSDAVEWMANAKGCDGRLPIRQERGENSKSLRRGAAGGIGDADEPRRQGRSLDIGEHADQWVAWSSGIALGCLDGKSRRVEPGIFPLVDGLPRGVVPSGDPGSSDYANATAEARTMRLRGYGNAIVPQVAAEFIRCALEADPAALKQRGRT